MFEQANHQRNSSEATDVDLKSNLDVSGRPSTQWLRWDMVCLIGSIIFTLATILVLGSPSPTPSSIVPVTVLPSPAVASVSPLSESSDVNGMLTESLSDGMENTSTLSPQEIERLLSTPPIIATPDSYVIVRDSNNPFTIIPERPRWAVTEYTAVPGDTISTIASRFGISPETVAWSNPRSYVQILQPGNVLNIMPVDGVFHTVFNEETIADVADKYDVDPFAIIDWESNELEGSAPETTLSSGTRLVVPGGIGEQISWSPQVVRVDGGGSGSAANGQISFSPGDPGSCGLIDNPGGGNSWLRPLSGYTWIRGYASWHPAADLAVPEGSPVVAATSGRVIFAGWNTFGYGYAVVLAHGPFTTIYAHLSSILVGCGQDVAPGQQIALSGNTGNSSGPHLHFEVRYNDIPQDPTLTVGL
ncbi:MAG: peptidoglycan DD-metalloendopeptidase family protein [Anaerolineae bacterium]|nr:peptidoglycan DD-metalloendopeptidase family protein [Anaerolineae bacterium]